MNKERISALHLRRINLTVLISIAVLSLVALLSFFLIDERVFSWLYNHPYIWLRGHWLMVIKGFGRAWLPIWLLLNWVCSSDRQRPALVGLLAIILIATVVPTLKVLVHRPRPEEVIAASATTEEAEEDSNDWWMHNLSFPSGDAAIVFAVATALAPFVRWPWVLSFFSIAGIVSFKRVASLAHYPSDVFAGAAIGVFSGWLALQIILRWLPEFRLRRGHAMVGAILVPFIFGVIEGIGELLVWLKTYSVLVVIIYLANAGTWLKWLRRRIDFDHMENTIITRQGKRVIFAIANTRVVVSCIFGFLVLFLLLFTGHSFSHGSAIDRLFEISGLFLLSIYGLGRLWALRYISGDKRRDIVAEGPYSIVRHPLYLFIGAVGIGLASENVLILVLIIIFYLFYYPFIIRAEEVKPAEKLGSENLKYTRETPWCLPKFSLYKEPAHSFVKTNVFVRNFVGGMWFIWVFMFMHFIEMLQNSGVLPVVLRVP